MTAKDAFREYARLNQLSLLDSVAYKDFKAGYEAGRKAAMDGDAKNTVESMIIDFLRQSREGHLLLLEVAKRAMAWIEADQPDTDDEWDPDLGLGNE